MQSNHKFAGGTFKGYLEFSVGVSGSFEHSELLSDFSECAWVEESAKRLNCSKGLLGEARLTTVVLQSRYFCFRVIPIEDLQDASALPVGLV